MLFLSKNRTMILFVFVVTNASKPPGSSSTCEICDCDKAPALKCGSYRYCEGCLERYLMTNANADIEKYELAFFPDAQVKIVKSHAQTGSTGKLLERIMIEKSDSADGSDSADSAEWVVQWVVQLDEPGDDGLSEIKVLEEDMEVIESIWAPMLCPERDFHRKMCKSPCHKGAGLSRAEVALSCRQLLPRFDSIMEKRETQRRKAKEAINNCRVNGFGFDRQWELNITVWPPTCPEEKTKEDPNAYMNYTKFCPMCFNALHKIPGGCRLMVCNKCAYRFCWECGAEAGPYKGKQRDGFCDMDCDENSPKYPYFFDPMARRHNSSVHLDSCHQSWTFGGEEQHCLKRVPKGSGHSCKNGCVSSWLWRSTTPEFVYVCQRCNHTLCDSCGRKEKHSFLANISAKKMIYDENSLVNRRLRLRPEDKWLPLKHKVTPFYAYGGTQMLLLDDKSHRCKRCRLQSEPTGPAGSYRFEPKMIGESSLKTWDVLCEKCWKHEL